MRKATKRGLLACLAVAGLVMVPVLVAAPGATASPNTVTASSVHREFDGPITSINRDHHTFRMSAEHRGIVKIKANKNTRYERPLHNFGDLHKGLRVDVNAHKKDGRWIADKIDRD